MSCGDSSRGGLAHPKSVRLCTDGILVSGWELQGATPWVLAGLVSMVGAAFAGWHLVRACLGRGHLEDVPLCPGAACQLGFGPVWATLPWGALQDTV